MSDKPNTTADRPLIHITLQPIAFRIGGALLMGLLLTLIIWLGVLSSPIVAGHPVILSPDRLVIKNYLDAAADWVQQLDRMASQLEAIDLNSSATARPQLMIKPTAINRPASTVMTTSHPSVSVTPAISLPPETPLPVLSNPVGWPDNLYDRAQQADQTVKDLQVIDTHMQRIEVPSVLSSLHTLAQQAVQEFALWSAALLDEIGAPTADNWTAIRAARQSARMALAAFQAAVDVQRKQEH